MLYYIYWYTNYRYNLKLLYVRFSKILKMRYLTLLHDSNINSKITSFIPEQRKVKLASMFAQSL